MVAQMLAGHRALSTTQRDIQSRLKALSTRVSDFIGV